MGADAELESTAPASIGVTVSGLVDAEKATAFGHVLANVVRSIGTRIDVSRLDGLTAADEYAAALREVDRGFEATVELSPSRNSDMIGTAMTVHVMREGVPKAHIVFDIEMLLPLYVYDSEHPEWWRALHMVAHECAHVEDLKRKDGAFPGILLRPQKLGWVDQNLGHVGLNFWEEYYACRRSAGFRPEATEEFSGVLLSCLEKAQDEVNGAIRSYRSHRDLGRLVSEALEPALRPLRAASYLFGHVEDLDGGWNSIEAVLTRVREHRLGDLIEEMLEELRRLWESRNDWTSMEEFEELVAIALEALERGGICVEEFPDGGCYLHVPFTAEAA
jgi:hypothetical protein